MFSKIKKFITAATLVATTVLAGCATAPQVPMPAVTDAARPELVGKPLSEELQFVVDLGLIPAQDVQHFLKTGYSTEYHGLNRNGVWDYATNGVAAAVGVFDLVGLSVFLDGSHSDVYEPLMKDYTIFPAEYIDVVMSHVKPENRQEIEKKTAIIDLRGTKYAVVDHFGPWYFGLVDKTWDLTKEIPGSMFWSGVHASNGEPGADNGDPGDEVLCFASEFNVYKDGEKKVLPEFGGCRTDSKYAYWK